MANNDIVGVGLNIDNEYLSNVVRNVALAEIAAAMDDKHQVVESIVRVVMNTKVNERGELARYNSDGRYTILEYYVRQMLTEEVKAQMKALVDEHREEVAALIREELTKQATVEQFTNAFLDSVVDALGYTWRTTINIGFEKREEY